MRLLWAHMLSPDLDEAKRALKDREGITAEDWESKIGSWHTGQPERGNILDLPKWAEAHGLDAAIWTALVPRFDKKDVSPSAEQVIGYLRGLTGTQRDAAKEYIERAPRQIDTEYRRRIEAALGWSVSKEHEQ